MPRSACGGLTWSSANGCRIERTSATRRNSTPPSGFGFATLYVSHHSSFLPAVLNDFDLPDRYTALAEKGLTQMEPAESA